MTPSGGRTRLSRCCDEGLAIVASFRIRESSINESFARRSSTLSSFLSNRQRLAAGSREGGGFIEPVLTNQATRPVNGGLATSSQVTQPCSRNQDSDAWNKPLLCCDHPSSGGKESS